MLDVDGLLLAFTLGSVHQSLLVHGDDPVSWHYPVLELLRILVLVFGQFREVEEVDCVDVHLCDQVRV